MAAPEPRDDDAQRRRRQRSLAYYLITSAIAVGLMLVALHYLQRIGNAMP